MTMIGGGNYAGFCSADHILYSARGLIVSYAL